VVLAVNDAEGEEGSSVDVAVSLLTAGKVVASAEHDLLFDSSILQLPDPASDCEINPALGVGQPGCLSDPQVGPCKTLQRNLANCPGATGCPPGFTGKRLHAVVTSIDNKNPIPEGSLYTCRFQISDGFLGATWVDTVNEKATAPDGSTLLADGINGFVTIIVPPIPTPEPSNCCTDRTDDGNPGCEDDACEACVCSVFPAGEFCCTDLWDATCVDIATQECEAECQCGS
jgi:hypothetical protein